MQASENKAYKIASQLAAVVKAHRESASEALRLRDTQIAQLKSELTASKDKAEQVKFKADLHYYNNAEIAHLKSQLASLEQKADQLEAQLALHTHNNKRCNITDIDKLKSQLTIAEHEIEQLKEGARASRKEINNLCKNTGTASNPPNNHNKLHKKNTKLHSNYAKLLKKKSNLCKEKNSLRNNCNKLRKDNKKLCKEKDNLRNNRNKLCNENNKLRNNRNKLCKEKDNLRNNRNELRNENSNLCKEKDNLRGNHNKLRKKNNRLCKKKDQLQAENLNLSDHIETGRLAIIECQRLETELKEVNTSKLFYLKNWLSLRGAIHTVYRIRAPQDPSKPQELNSIRVQVSKDLNSAYLEVFRKGKSALSRASVKPAPESRKA